MVDRKTEMEEFVRKFKAEFHEKYGYKPYVIFRKKAEGISPQISLEVIHEVTNMILVEHLTGRGIAKFVDINIKGGSQDVMDFRHAAFKVAQDLGHSRRTISQYFNTNDPTVRAGIKKIEKFLSIRDIKFMNILNKIEHGIKDKQSGTTNPVQSDSSGETHS